MNFSPLFIQRPVATSLLMAATLMLGLLALFKLPVAALPEAEYPIIVVQTFYPGASPEVMTSGVTSPLETQFGQMAGLSRMSSSSAAGVSVLVLQFELDLSLDVAEQEVQAAINAAGNLLPSDLPSPPTYAKVNPASAPILSLAIRSKTLPLSEVASLADNRLAQAISRLPGVGFVNVGGGQKRAVRIQVNPAALAARGLNIDDLRTTIGNANVNAPKGTLEGPNRGFVISANDQIASAEEFRSIVIAYKNGDPVRLADVAQVIEGPENSSLSASVNNVPAVILNVQRQPGANVVAVADRIRAELPALQATLPPTVDVSILVDRTNVIRAAVVDVEKELLISIALVVVVIFLFLRDAPATLIPSLSIPLSIVGAFCAMYLFGYSLNTLTLMALTIATGFVVDDSIVMIENVKRHVENGETPFAAALKGARQIGFTIVSLTVSLVAVLIPLLFMEGMVGRLFREFAVTLAVTIVISAIVALTLVPMLCARLPRARRKGVGEVKESWFDRLVASYGRALSSVLDRPRLTLIGAALTLGLTVALYVAIPKGFLPVQDTGLILGVSVAEPTVSYEAMMKRQSALVAVLLEDPDVQSISSLVGVDAANLTLNTGQLTIALVPSENRATGVDEVIRRLVGKADAAGGMKLYLRAAQDLAIDATPSRAEFQLTLRGGDADELALWTGRLVDRLTETPELADVSPTTGSGSLSAHVKIDRDRAARLGLTSATIDNALYDAFGQRIISTIFTQSDQRRVILEIDPKLLGRSDILSTIYLPTAAAGQTPLSSVATLTEWVAPLRIDHLGRLPASTISFNLAPGYALGEATRAIEKAEAELGVPATLVTSFQGAALAFQSSVTSEVFLILAAIVTVYIVLGVLYESFVHPLTILSTLPSAGVGALVALMLAKTDLGVIGVIGIVLLIGIVKKNAIMMIDFALDAQRRQGKSAREAIFQASLLRFRPILMTTLAALLAALPLALGLGPGSELRHPLGVSIIGGLIVSQILTLFTTPVIYLAFDSLARRFSPQPDQSAIKAQGSGA